MTQNGGSVAITSNAGTEEYLHLMGLCTRLRAVELAEVLLSGNLEQASKIHLRIL